VETWTPRDEEALAKLAERKERVNKARRAPLARLIFEGMPNVHTHDMDDVVDWFINNADRLRDMLAPFDSGVRAAPETFRGQP
jgi:hypothetical protein